MRLKALALLALLAFAAEPLYAQNALSEATAALVKHGRYGALAADCVSCHMAPDAKAFRGGAVTHRPANSSRAR